MDEKKIAEVVVKQIESKMKEMKENIETAKAMDEKKEIKKTVDEKGQNKTVLRTEKEYGKMAHKVPFISVDDKMKSYIERLQKLATGDVLGAMEKAASGQNEGNDEEGGYLVVPAELDAAIIQYQWQESVMRKFASVYTTRGNSREFNKLDQGTNSFGGVVTYWGSEAGAMTSSKFNLGRLKMETNKLYGLSYSTNELLQDSIIDVANYLVQIFGAAISYKEDLAFFQGTGNGQPQGVLTYSDLKTVNRATANKISYADITKMFHSLRTNERKNGVFVGSATAAEYIDLVVDGNGRPLFTPSTNPNDPYEMRLKGKPFIEVDEAYLPALGTKGDLIFLDASKYYILDKLGMKIDVSMHNKFETDEMTWRFVKRLDGQLTIEESAVALDVPA